MWALGRDARARGAKGGFGQQYRRLPVPTLYLHPPRASAESEALGA